MDVKPRRLVAFDTATGDRVARVPGRWSVSEEHNGHGRIAVTSQWSREALALKTWNRVAEARTVLAVIEGTGRSETGGRVVCAGPVTDMDSDPKGFTINAAASYSKRFEWLKLLNPALADTTIDGELLIDPDNPRPEWVWRREDASYEDIAADMVDTGAFWAGGMPVTTPAREGGVNERTINGWELHDIWSRIKLLTEIQNGIEVRFAPRMREDGGLDFDFEAAPELIRHYHVWNSTLPGQRVQWAGTTRDASGLASDVWAMAGKTEGVVLAARTVSTALTSIGWPVMQTSLTDNQSVTRLETLKAHTNERATRGSKRPEVYTFKVHRSWPLVTGDWVDVRIVHPAYEGYWILTVKVLSIDHDAGEWMTVKGRQRDGI